MLRCQHNLQYEKDRDGNPYRTVEDEVVEVLMEEQHKSQFSTYTAYIDNFVRV